MSDVHSGRWEIAAAPARWGWATAARSKMGDGGSQIGSKGVKGFRG